MQIGLFFGSFNPIHVGHLALANYFTEFANLNEVWFVVSPQNPFKEKAQLLNQNNRLHLVELAINNHPKMRSSNIEFSLPQPSYTVNTLAHLKEKYPTYNFSLILGEDNLENFNKWKNYEYILENHKLLVYPRPGSIKSIFHTHKNVKLLDAPLIEISSTFIRNAIKANKDIRFFVPEKVWEEINASGFYK
ncbi:MAG: nicotinate-nucleotide adenylyltransferase [Bacteroidetes bacterium]|nr:nicotinate-nucleotide adenylyltransferase [Bacteroidota bacterium]